MSFALRTGSVVAPLVALLVACGAQPEQMVAGTATSTSSTTTSATPTTSTTTASTSTTTSTSPTTTTTTPTTTSTTTTVPPAADDDTNLLGRGDAGPAVRQLQQRLRDLRFWIGPENDFGWLTEQAVYAFQKANGIAVDGVAGPETRAALAAPVAVTPRSDQGQVVEIDKSRQLLYIVVDGELHWVFHTSTGTEQPYPHPAGYTALADTPPGKHEVFWEVDGWQEGVLGPLYRPKYFHEDGIAVHGYDPVPPYPASHGCVRVPFAAMDYIWANGLMPLGSTVLVYGESPGRGPAV